MKHNIIKNARHFDSAHHGAWNDPDMLEVGVNLEKFKGLTLLEERTHMALWCISKAPLIIGANLNTISDDSLAVLTNKNLIGLD